jgi:uncharacterized membrane protein
MLGFWTLPKVKSCVCNQEEFLQAAGDAMLHIVSLLCLAVMTGNELCVGAFVEPVLRQLPDPEQIAAVPRIAARLGRWMPFWYATSLILTCWDCIDTHMRTGVWRADRVASVVLQVVILIMTLSLLVPINNRLAKMTRSYEGWSSDARRWDTLHRVRIALLLGAALTLAL